jgi:hypothetical protein
MNAAEPPPIRSRRRPDGALRDDYRALREQRTHDRPAAGLTGAPAARLTTESNS